MNKKERILQCRGGEQHWVCVDCADKYSENLPYEYPLTVHTGVCYICEKETTVGPSRKLFGFYKSDIHK